MLSADNKLVAIPLTDNTVKVWEVVSGRHVTTYTGPDLRLINVEFSPDGKSIAGVYWPKVDRLRPDESGTLIVWDTATAGGYEFGMAGVRRRVHPDGSDCSASAAKSCVADQPRVRSRAGSKDTHRCRNSPASDSPRTASGSPPAAVGIVRSSSGIWRPKSRLLDIDASCGGVNTSPFPPTVRAFSQAPRRRTRRTCGTPRAGGPNTVWSLIERDPSSKSSW